MDFTNKGEFTFLLKKEYLKPYDSNNNPLGLNLEEWFENYAKEAKVSTAGIRGPQNILQPQDTRFPINLVGIVLATLAKALVAKEKYPNKRIVKVAGCEVRYNSKLFLDAIARIQAAQGIETLVPEGRKTIPIWLASFLAFKLHKTKNRVLFLFAFSQGAQFFFREFRVRIYVCRYADFGFFLLQFADKLK
jgi:hypothetical protein